jgi:hypothetical protein
MKVEVHAFQTVALDGVHFTAGLDVGAKINFAAVTRNRIAVDQFVSRSLY